MLNDEVRRLQQNNEETWVFRSVVEGALFIYLFIHISKSRYNDFPYTKFLELPYDIIRSKCHDWPGVRNNIIL
jgi:hypothetical protein